MGFLDNSGDIILDAGGADLIFKDGGTEIARFTNSSSDLFILWIASVLFLPWQINLHTMLS